MRREIKTRRRHPLRQIPLIQHLADSRCFAALACLCLLASAQAKSLNLKRVLIDQVGHEFGEWCQWAPITTGKTNHSQRYRMLCGGKTVIGSSLQIHHLHNANKSARAFMKSKVPKFRRRAMSFGLKETTWTPLEDLGYSIDHWYPQQVIERTPMWLGSDSELRPVWSLIVASQDRATRRVVWVDADSGQILRNSALGFHTAPSADVFSHSNVTDSLERHSLAYLNQPFQGFLNGTHFSIFDGSSAAQRAEASNHTFSYSPSQEPTLFDQVQTYFNLSKAWSWFVEDMAFTPSSEQLKVRTHMLINGYDPDNAKYEPRTQTLAAELQFGSGSSQIQNLSRDPDVAFHELSHHFIYHFIDDNQGTAGILHEGFADYFTYAISDNPNLGESLFTDRPYLRTALLDETYRYDNPAISRRSHKMGQVWAATLWDLRKAIGKPFDETVLKALTMLDANSDFSEVFDSLIAADGLVSLEAADSDDNNPSSPNYCTILHTANQRGFSYFLAHLDGIECGLDLMDLALKSQANLQSAPSSSPKDDGFRLLGKPCAVLPGSISHFQPFFICLLLLPLLVAFIPKRDAY